MIQKMDLKLLKIKMEIYRNMINWVIEFKKINGEIFTDMIKMDIE
jgi:hypothetical protein